MQPSNLYLESLNPLPLWVINPCETHPSTSLIYKRIKQAKEIGKTMSVQEVFKEKQAVHQFVFGLHYRVPSSICWVIADYTSIMTVTDLQFGYQLSLPRDECFKTAVDSLTWNLNRMASFDGHDFVFEFTIKIMACCRSFNDLYYALNQIIEQWEDGNHDTDTLLYMVEQCENYAQYKNWITNEIYKNILHGQYDCMSEHDFKKTYAKTPWDMLDNDKLYNSGIIDIENYLLENIQEP